MDEKKFYARKHKFVKEFIHLYKSFPCLWQIKSKEYHIRDLRANAYKVLTNKLKEIDNGADRAAVVRKINSLRSNLRKEKRKVQKLAKIGIQYRPKLWYYPYFSFLDGQGRDSTDGENEDDQVGIDGTKKNESEEDSVDAPINVKVENYAGVMETETEVEGETDDPLHSFEILQEEDSDEEPTPKKVANSIARPDFVQASSSKIATLPRIANTYSEKCKSPANYESREDQCDVFGKNVAAKLRDVALKDNTQRLMAEKIINDALFMAQMGHLTLSHCNKLNFE